MNFLAPLFLFGALAIAGPVIFHLIRRTTRERQRFGSLMFLEPTPPRLTRRSRIEHWLLLLLRAAALALLALAFARPFFRTKAPQSEQGTAGNRTVVLVDTSASLRRAGMWDDTKARALKAAKAASEDGAVALVAFDRVTSPLLTFDEWQRSVPDARMELLRERIDSVSPSWAGTNAAAALMAAAELMAESADRLSGKREIVLVTDAQEGSRLEALQGYEWPKDVRVRIETVAPKRPGNAGLQLAAESRANESTDATQGVRLRVSNSPDATGESFQLGWQAEGGAFDGSATDVYVPPGQSRIVTLPWPAGGPKTGRAMLRGDAEEFDNVVTITPPPSVTVPVIHSGNAAGPRSPLFFLQKALPAGRFLTTTLVHHAPDAVPPAETVKLAPLWVITAPLEAPVAAAAGNYAAGGGTVLVMLDSPEMAATLQTITHNDAVPLELVKPRTFAMFGTIDFGHPLFSAFAEPRFSDFTKIRYWNYIRIDPASLTNSKVIAKFDSGDPAVIEAPRDAGRVFVLAAGWHPAASQLALSSKFPSVLASLLATTGAGARVPSQYFAGEPVAASTFLPPSVDKADVMSPSGKPLAATRAGTFAGFTEPGLYRVTWDGGQRELAVNPDPAESRTAPLAAEEFEKHGTPLAGESRKPVAPSPAAESLAAAAEAEGRQKLWRWLIAGVFAVLLIETLLGTRTARHYSAAEGGSTL